MLTVKTFNNIIGEINGNDIEFITSSSPEINPCIRQTTIDATVSDIHISMKGSTTPLLKTITVIGLNAVYLNTTTGTFYLTAANTPKTLIYSPVLGTWNFTDNAPSNILIPINVDTSLLYAEGFAALRDTLTTEPLGFGSCSAITYSGETLIVSSLNEYGKCGNIRVLTIDTSTKIITYVQNITQYIPNENPLFMGYSIAISADDSIDGPNYSTIVKQVIITAAFGAPSINIGGPLPIVSSVYIYLINRASSILQTRILTPADVIGVSSQFGAAVALSDNGNVLAAGGPGDNVGIGAVWIFNRTLYTPNFVNGATWTQKTKLLPSGAIGASRFGTAVALSGDGNVLVVGGPSDDTNIGAIWIFTYTNAWAATAKLVGNNPLTTPRQGVSVAISRDGITAACFAPFDNGNAGAAYTFRLINSTWTQYGNKLVPINNTGSAPPFLLGAQVSPPTSVKLNADGLKLYFGDPYVNGGTGYLYVYVDDASTFVPSVNLLQNIKDFKQSIGFTVAASLYDGTGDIIGDASTAIIVTANPRIILGIGRCYVLNDRLQIALFTPSDVVQSSANFSSSDIDDIGTIVVSGATDALSFNQSTGATTKTGAVIVYVRDGDTWNQQQVIFPAVIDPQTVVGNPPWCKMGISCGIGGTGTSTTIIAGAPSDSFALGGALFVFRQTSGKWMEYQKLIPSNPVGANNSLTNFGHSCAISTSSLYIAIGRPVDDASEGAVWIFVYSGTTYVEQQKLIPTGADPASGFGHAVAINSTGNLLAVYSLQDDGGDGSVITFTRTGTVWTQQQRILPGIAGATIGVPTLSLNDTRICFNVAAGDLFIYELIAGTWTLENTFAGTYNSSVMSRNGSTIIATDTTGDFVVVYIFIYNGTDWESIYNYSTDIPIEASTLAITTCIDYYGGVGCIGNSDIQLSVGMGQIFS